MGIGHWLVVDEGDGEVLVARHQGRRGGGRAWGSHGGGGEGIGRRELRSLARCMRVSGGASRGTRERGVERVGGLEEIGQASWAG